MRIAILIREHDALSLIRYRECVMQELLAQGVIFLPFSGNEPVPAECDIVWDPGMGRNRLPLPAFRNLDCPLVITLHGSATFTMKWHEVYSSPIEAIRDKWANVAAMREWKWFREKLAAVIAVSRYGAHEASLVYNIHQGRIKSIYHGADQSIFFKDMSSRGRTEPYFLHVSAFQPKKNVKRLIDAYKQLPANTRPKLIVVSPGFVAPQIAGLTIIDSALSSSALASLYNGALAFIFPSLHETFGLPIIEAMACGCPVVTSFDTACAEVADNAALLVNPRSTEDIAHAMARLINEPDLRTQLSQKGLTQASQFTWAETARSHLSVFGSLLNMKIETDKKPPASTCIIVLGMHRSGTSALSGILSLLGIQPGDNLLPAKEDVNPKGFWEHTEIVSIHEQLLTALDSSWDDESALPDQWWLSPLAISFRNRIISVLRRDFSGQPIWLIKDPRICRLLPLWQQVLRELDCKPLYVLSIRNPAEVARSLLKRNELPEEISCLLWLTHMLEAEHQTRGQQRVFINYENLLSDWKGTMTDVGKTLGITWPVAMENAAPDIESFLDPSLRHHSNVNMLPNHPACRLAQKGLALFSAPDPKKLDCLSAQTTKLINLVSPSSRRLRLHEKHIRDLENQIRDLESQISDFESRHCQLESENLALQTEIMRLKSTYSWHVTKPFRFVANLPRLIKTALLNK